MGQRSLLHRLAGVIRDNQTVEGIRQSREIKFLLNHLVVGCGAICRTRVWPFRKTEQNIGQTTAISFLLSSAHEADIADPKLRLGSSLDDLVMWLCGDLEDLVRLETTQ